MPKNWIISSLLLLFLLSGCSMVSEISKRRSERILQGPEFPPYSGLKRRIAVLDFQNATERGVGRIGETIADMLVGILVRSDRFTVVEREEIDRILEEQGLGQMGVLTEESAPEAGRLLGIQSVVMGTIEELRHESGKQEVEPEEEDWKLALQATVGLVRLRFKVINTLTGERILSDAVKGTEIRPGFGLKTKDFDFEDLHQFDQTVLGFASRKAVNEMAAILVEEVYQLEWYGKVVKVLDDGSLYFTPGRGDGVRIGDQFDIYQREVDTQIGRVEVIGFVGDKVSKALVLWGEGLERGDLVREIK
jgi:curli biogenesis system outer membrane secretion channel CsgG